MAAFADHHQPRPGRGPVEQQGPDRERRLHRLLGARGRRRHEESEQDREGEAGGAGGDARGNRAGGSAVPLTLTLSPTGERGRACPRLLPFSPPAGGRGRERVVVNRSQRRPSRRRAAGVKSRDRRLESQVHIGNSLSRPKAR